VNLHTDIPTRGQIDRLLTNRDPSSVSVYVPTDPASSGDADRIELKNLAAEAVRQLEEAGTPKADVSGIDEQLAELDADGTFWRFQARSLALFATPGSLVTFRLPNRLVAQVQVSDRFHLKPLLRAVTFPQVAFVLALAQGSVRVLEVGAELGSWDVEVPDLPSDVASAAGMASIADRAPRGAVQGSEGQKVRMRQYSRQIDQALRPILAGLDVPLILASTEPLDGIYRSVNTYPHLAEQSVPGSPEASSDSDLVAGATYSIDTVRRLRRVLGPSDRLFFLIGADASCFNFRPRIILALDWFTGDAPQHSQLSDVCQCVRDGALKHSLASRAEFPARCKVFIVTDQSRVKACNFFIPR